MKSAAAALQEATETAAQTAKEAAGGDRQAQKLMLHRSEAVPHGSTTGSIINTKA
ncbi:MAG: hypothetical protein JWN85_2368 [Gammaproteobacteria bacterium]|nr:hypothetical protein [Gammaproteobacteria bacterium]